MKSATVRRGMGHPAKCLVYELGSGMFSFFNGLIDPIRLAAMSPILRAPDSAVATGVAG
ncbi:hypothetical protein ACFPTO_23165 [Paraburkholderia denitrificans]|uniref:Uncharacterized protein n=1 Tax=Paraburkholderia denitrificans TaxID=694025 RepID=A0ABW0JEU9_9BURK